MSYVPLCYRSNGNSGCGDSHLGDCYIDLIKKIHPVGFPCHDYIFYSPSPNVVVNGLREEESEIDENAHEDAPITVHEEKYGSEEVCGPCLRLSRLDLAKLEMATQVILSTRLVDCESGGEDNIACELRDSVYESKFMQDIIYNYQEFKVQKTSAVVDQPEFGISWAPYNQREHGDACVKADRLINICRKARQGTLTDMFLEENQNWVSQNDVPEGGCGVVKRLCDNLNDFFKTYLWSNKEEAVDVITAGIRRIGAAFTSLVGLISEKIAALLSNMVDRLVGAALGFVCLGTMGVMWLKNTVFTKKLCLAVTCFALIAMAACSLFSYGNLKSSLCSLLGYEVEFSSEGAQDHVANVGGICGALFGHFGGFDKKILANHCIYLCKVVAAGNILWSGINGLFFLLPSCLQRSITMAVGGKTAKEGILLEEWRVKAEMLLKTRTVSVVLVSDPYYAALLDCLRTGLDLSRDMKNPNHRLQFVQIYMQLVRIHGMLIQYREESGSRRLPFSLHISGNPGCGKTLLVPRLAFDVFGVDKKDLYNVPVERQHWNGYIAQEAIWYDEFLISKENEDAEALEYLSLVSTANFKAKMASVDNPSVGMKGTSAKPKVVFTSNNNAYNRPSGVPSTAFQRRRNLVVLCEVKPEARLKKNSCNVDMSKYTCTEMAKFSWMQFKIVPGEYRSNFDIDIVPYISYDQLVTQVRFEYDEHLEICDKLCSSVSVRIEDECSPQEIMDRVLRENMGIPSKPVGVIECLGKLVGWNSQSDTKEECPCGGEIIYGAGSGGSFSICQKCGITRSLRRVKSSGDISEASSNDEENVSVSMREFRSRRPERIKSVAERKNDSDWVKGQLLQSVPHPASVIRETESNETMHSATDDIHIGVDAAGLHVHHCEECKGMYMHSHPNNETHDLLCPRCTKLRENGFAEENTILDTDRVLEDFNRIMQADLMCIMSRADSAYLSTKLLSIEKEKNGFLDTTKKVWKIISIACSLVMVVMGVRGLFGNQGKMEEEISFSAEVAGTVSSTRSSRTSQTPTYANHFQKGLGLSAQAAKVAQAILHIRDYKTRVFGVKDRWIAFNRHTLFDKTGRPMVKDGDLMTLTYNGRNYEAIFNESNILVSMPEDMVLMHFTCDTLPFFPNSVKRMLEREQMGPIEGLSISMNSLEGKFYSKSRKVMNKGYKTPEGVIRLDSSFVYLGKTVPGDCGTVVQIVEGEHAGKIIGIHCAGSDEKGEVARGCCNVMIKEVIEEALNMDSICLEEVLGGDFVAQNEEAEFSGLPNCRRIVLMPYSLNHVVTHSKLEKSAIYFSLPWECELKPAILSRGDVRASGRDPVSVAIKELLSVEQVEVDEKLVETVFGTMAEKYSKMKFPVGIRRLTLDEALRGIPGKLSSVNTKTSPGFPLIKTRIQPGKRDHVWFDQDGELHYTAVFAQMVEQFLADMSDGKIRHNVWLAALKDELQAPHKIDQCRTRTVYAGDFVATVAFRMVFGSILCAFNSAHDYTPMAIGLNQFSYDMDVMYEYLSEYGDQFVAGDYKSFDKFVNGKFQRQAYLMIKQIAGGLVSDEEFEFFFEHQAKSEIWYDKWKITPVVGHMSGCIFTTVVGSLINEGYMRYMFAKLNPGKYFDDYVKAKFLIDDHVLGVRKGCTFSPGDLMDNMHQLGQIYTDDKKTNEVRDFRSFEDITFLGAHPRKVNGRWSGALRKKTLEASVMWVRDRGESMKQTCEAMVEFASQWDEEYFDYYRNAIQNALLEVGEETLDLPCREEMRRCVADRTVSSGMYTAWGFQSTYTRETWKSQGGDLLVNAKDEKSGPTRDSVAEGLTGFHTDEIQCVNCPPSFKDIAPSLGQPASGLEFGTEGYVFRKTYTWTKNDGIGHNIAKIRAPDGILELGNVDNLQNMPFDRYIYWHGEVEIMVQINGNPFQQGLAIIYFYPFGPDGSTVPQIANVTSCRHMFINPNTNTSACFKVPFKFPRNVMNTHTWVDTFGPAEYLGHIYIRVLAPLTVSSLQDEQCYVSVYSRFPNSEFRVPKPLQTSTLRADDAKEWSSEGQGPSKAVTTNNYNISDVAGELNLQTDATARGQQMDISADVDAVVPMDNPMLASGAVPVMNVFSGLAKSNGVEPTVALQLHPAAVAERERNVTDVDETTIDFLLSRKTMIGTFNWDKTDPENKIMVDYNLNSFLDSTGGTSVSFVDYAVNAVNLYVLNQFIYWHADMVFEIVAARTKLQSGRLRASVAYGTDTFKTGFETAYYSQILDFNGQQDRCTFRVPFNSATEFLRTYEGEGTYYPIQDHSLGMFRLSVANKLRAASTVPAAVRIMVFVHFDNAKVAVPRPMPPYVIETIKTGGTVVDFDPRTKAEARDTESGWVSQSDAPTAVAVNPGIEQNVGEAEGAVTQMPKKRTDRMCRLNNGSKFEYTVQNVLDVVRRGQHIPTPSSVELYSRTDHTDQIGVGVHINVRPWDRFSNLYAGWSGGIKYRILHQQKDSIFVHVAFLPVPIGLEDKYEDVSGVIMKNNSAVHAGGGSCQFASSHTPGAFPIAREVTFPCARGAGYIDVHVPYQSHFNFSQMPVLQDGGTMSPQHTGVLMLYNTHDNTTADPIDFLFASGADDFMLHMFRPPFKVNKEGFTGATNIATAGTYLVGGWHVVKE